MTSATCVQLQSHVPCFHSQQWSHMFVKMCVLCAFSSLICSPAFPPMSLALPGGPRPKPHAIYTDPTAGALPAKAVGVGEWVEKLSWKLQVKPSVGNVCLLTFFPPTPSRLSLGAAFTWGTMAAMSVGQVPSDIQMSPTSKLSFSRNVRPDVHLLHFLLVKLNKKCRFSSSHQRTST